MLLEAPLALGLDNKITMAQQNLFERKFSTQQQNDTPSTTFPTRPAYTIDTVDEDSWTQAVSFKQLSG